MASTTTEQTSSQNTTSIPSAPRNGGRARRGGGASSGGEGGAARGGRGRGGPRRLRGGIGRGSSNGPGEQTPHGNGQPQIVMRVPPARPEGESPEDSDSDTTICFICADPVRYNAIPPCNHSTCHICSLRMRALYKSKMCAHCRTESEFVIFTKDADKHFEEFKDSEIIAQNDALGIKYDGQDICDDATLLLRYNCPESTCDQACLGWPDLHRHVKSEHGRVMCDLCTRHKKVFTHEHELFTAAELRRHERYGDDVPGSESQSGFKGHPECGFCSQRFYSGDELYVHCRDKHERCHICDRRRQSDNQPQYYINYDALEAHFRKSHFICSDDSCLEKKFVVFENEIDLKAHQLEAHPNGLSKTARRDARRIDISSFSFVEDARVHQPPPRGGDRRRGGRGGRDGSGRGWQEPSDDGPIRTDQNLSRAEIAFQRTRQLAIQSSQSTTTRTFGGQLSEPASAARPTPQPQPPRPAPPPAETPSLRQPVPGNTPRVVPGNIPATPVPSRVSGNIPATPVPSSNVPAAASAFPPLSAPRPQPPLRAQTPLNPTDARALRHAAVIERTKNMLRGDDTKMQLFRADIGKFRAGSISGDNLVDMLWSLFDVSAKELSTLLNEVAELYEDEAKKKELLRAWNNWKAINEDYPPIAGASSQSASTSTATNRVLKLKSSTARSSRSAAASAWGTAASSNAFPSLVQNNPNRVGKGAVSATPWVSPQAAPAPATAASSRPRAVVADRKDEFPSLPPKRMPAGWTPVPSRGSPVQVGNAWVPEQSQQQQERRGEGEEQTGGRKKKGKGKQLLFHVGL